MVEEPIDIASIPLKTLCFDQTNFDRLTAANKHLYLEQIGSLVELGFLVRNGRPMKELAYIDIAEFDTFEDFIAYWRKAQRGNGLRHARRAERLGYYSKFFNPYTFIFDIVSVNNSTQVRQGQSLPAYYRRSVKPHEYPVSLHPEIPPEQSFAWFRHFGTFRRKPGHRQGDIVVDEELLAYMMVCRCGDILKYMTFLGHTDHWREGVTYKLHKDMVETVFDQRSAEAAGSDSDPSLGGIRYLFSSKYYTTQRGLTLWKSQAGFQPAFFELDYPQRTRVVSLTAPAGSVAPETPCAVVSFTEKSIEGDYRYSELTQIDPSERTDFSLFGGSEGPSNGVGCTNLMHAFGRPQLWRDFKTVLVGRLLNKRHEAQTDALLYACHRVAPHALVFAAMSRYPYIEPSPTGRRIGEWLLRRCAEIAAATNPLELAARPLARLFDRAGYYSHAVQLLLHSLGKRRCIRRSLWVGHGAGFYPYFLLSGEMFDDNPEFVIIEPAQSVHDALRELYEIGADNDRPPLSLRLVAGTDEIDLAAEPRIAKTVGSWDLVVFDGLQRFAPEQRREVLSVLWNRLSEDGLLWSTRWCPAALRAAFRVHFRETR
jgi:hypothetical protein